MEINYPKIISHIETLPWCALITTGRVGTDFFQSLLDSHPEVFVFNGSLFFYNFWEKSYCVNYSGNIEVEDLADEFIGNFIYKLKSKYDYAEGKDRLGEKKNESVNIDLLEFKKHLVNLAKQRNICSKNFLQSVYIAYAICLGQNIEKKKLFFHHIHHSEDLDKYLKDFPESKIIAMIRDFKATFVSGVEHWFRYRPNTDFNLWRVFVSLERIVNEVSKLKKYGNESAVLRLEDLEDEKKMHQICKWLGISYDPCLRKSTWAGLRWWGDRLSTNSPKPEEQGFSKTVINSNPGKKLNIIDEYLLDFLLSKSLEYYGYQYKKYRGLHHYIIALIAILLPSVYEKKFLSISFISIQIKQKKWRGILKNLYYYIKRIILYYRLYYRKVIGEKPDIYILGNTAI
ncbi:MAG: sulfotransferase [Candidatus Omnitrophica bacterium]|nr:sulfotransferase [Candidatus Omnitrophota bacterium]MDD5352379.1 sulfotransferase [Candidatus Omnitrophota bacterium]MDD5549977.1 sulfotransferase [Candidatus Omnitrophota bacterium]